MRNSLLEISVSLAFVLPSAESQLVIFLATMDTNYLQEIRRETVDVFNRLRSIEEDAAFVREVHEAFPDLPLLRRLPPLSFVCFVI